MAGPLTSLFSAVDSQKRKSKNFLRALVTKPDEALEYLAAEIDRTLEEARRDPSQWLGRGLGGGAAGIIRRGGDPALSLIHQAALSRLAPVTGKLAVVAEDRIVPSELASPSMAINRGAVTQNFGGETGTVTLVARPDVFDPVRMPQGQLFNRDAFTPRAKDFYGTGGSQLLRQASRDMPEAVRRGSIQDMARSRLQERVGVAQPDVGLPYGTDLRLRERGVMGEDGWIHGFQGAEHTTSIRQSPNFRSFREFEASPKGAALLDDGSNPMGATIATMKAGQDLEEVVWRMARDGNPAAKAVWGDLGGKSNDLGRALATDEWRKMSGAREFERAAVIPYRNALSFAPSQYAELKVPGSVGLHGGNWAGAIIKPNITDYSTSAAEANALRDILSGRGIPTVVPQSLDEEGLGWLARQMSERSLKR